MGAVFCRAEQRSARPSAARPYTPLSGGAVKGREPRRFRLFLPLTTNHLPLTFTNPARPMTARPTSPWSFWKANPSAKPSRGGVRQ